VLRGALLKQQRQLSYEEPAFHLEDSASFRAFARLPLGWSPKKSVLHQTIGALRAETWEAVNQALLASAKQDRLESGATVRLDSTVSAALMHEPSDSTLLWDAVRGHDAPVAPGSDLAGSAGSRVARPPASGQEADARNRVQPRVGQQAPALWRADRRRSRRLTLPLKNTPLWTRTSLSGGPLFASVRGQQVVLTRIMREGWRV
jgi:IS5 family transposase